MTTITITKPELVRVAALFQMRDETRYALCGVHYERAPQGGILIVSTDGVRLSVGYDPEGSIEGDESATIDLPKPFLAQLKPDSGTLILTTDHARLAGDKPALSESTWIDPPFPDWRRVIPEDFGNTCAGGFGAPYLAAYAQAGKFMGQRIPDVRIVGLDAVAPHLVRIAGIDSWFGILMPVEQAMATIPSWFNAKS